MGNGNSNSNSNSKGCACPSTGARRDAFAIPYSRFSIPLYRIVGIANSAPPAASGQRAVTVLSRV